jgi:hypothetical protein
MAKYKVEVEIPEGKCCESFDSVCMFLEHNTGGMITIQCRLLNKTVSPHFPIMYAHKDKDCPSLKKDQPERVDGTMDCERG